MSVTSSDILDTARLCLNKKDESGYRSAISRAYYSMLHEAISSLTCLPHFTREHHKNTVGYMSNSAECKNEPYPAMSLKSLAYVLKTQRDARNEADYELQTVTISEEMAQDVIEAAEEFFERWTLLKTPKAS
ncbi:HEPN domain-containing protein [Rahnella sp. SAP-1]|uniref:HEPN domain-containing protein n=1 Tax=Rouxiella aceris TaxID=2703884 RepID=A0A848MEZ0_9GAMM|nr:HEPN domain-containing protein [Rouxiella aceris]NMP26838.1 HEPN domain-containing protein [Rouxiella aceris]